MGLTDTVDVVAQGVRIASGEVVVVHDRYGIRITEIDAASTPAAGHMLTDSKPAKATK